MYVNSGENCHSRPNELVSPRREYQKLTLVLLEHLAQAESSCFERRIVSLKREWLAQASTRGNQLFSLLASSSKRGTLVLGEWWSRPSEMVSPKRKLVECHYCRTRSSDNA
ncbi:hypothetical protein DEO72_LG5g1900 [Vigna unguiculata]|uniref:Uncharacterized protein n=1 Tax=Vigna unguiculata TaxID=3917 RepID=A0A4D6M191_VIGUN|nr:hypothetical protein DEO72_LG5g1900 [Vigna unguiculata]